MGGEKISGKSEYVEAVKMSLCFRAIQRSKFSAVH